MWVPILSHSAVAAGVFIDNTVHHRIYAAYVFMCWTPTLAHTKNASQTHTNAITIFAYVLFVFDSAVPQGKQ